MNQQSRQIGWANAPSQNRGLYLAAIAVLIAFIISLCLDWKSTLLSITTIVAIGSVLFSCLRLAACLSPLPTNIRTRLRRSELPPYTVLVPLYNEANMIGALISALDKLDYPRDRLQIFLIC